MAGVVNFFHHLFNPHCPECEEHRVCVSCSTLREQLVQANYEKKQLLETILNFQKPIGLPQSIPSDDSTPQPVPNKFTPWRVRQQILEEEDRAKATILRRKAEEDRINAGMAAAKEAAAKEVEQLEKELGIVEELK